MPCNKMPVLYIFAANAVVKTNPKIRQATDAINSRTVGALNGILAIITMGDVNGNILPNIAVPLLGSLSALIIIINATKIGMVIGIVNEFDSCESSLTRLPTAANKAAYKK